MPFLSRTDVRSSVRLSCQVKVKDNMKVQVPDFLETVRDMVKNKTFDPNTRWRFIKNPQVEAIVNEPANVFVPADMQSRMDGIFAELRDMPGSIVPILQRVTEAFNHIPEPALRLIGKELKIPVPTVYRIATFYHAFSLKPKGKHMISVCTGTACHVKGAGKILEAIERELGIKSGETTSDGMFSLQPVRCIGCCGLAPVVTIDQDVHGQMTLNKITAMLDTYRKGAADAKAAN
jgi:NADH:ubiquinone oxidoreductase subunit E